MEAVVNVEEFLLATSCDYVNKKQFRSTKYYKIVASGYRQNLGEMHDHKLATECLIPNLALLGGNFYSYPESNNNH